MFDGARRCIKPPTKKLVSLILELNLILRKQVIPFKHFEKLVGRLRHAAIGLHEGKGLCTPFNRVTSIHPKMVNLEKAGTVHEAFLDRKLLLIYTRVRTTLVNELVGQPITDVGNMGASSIGAGVIWMSIAGEYINMVWRVE